MSQTARSPSPDEVLKPYVPRVVIQWLRETPAASHRAIDGTLAFVDISGFTALTELLARRGKVGAELMRDTLDGVFTALLDEAYEWGAGLLKWGGDALLLFFDGAGHEERAARAMWELQRTIASVGRLSVGSKTIVLRMSIGVATGPVDFFVAGSVHRELLVAGPTVTETVSIEAIADAGEIGLSPALAQRLGPAVVGSAPAGIALLTAPPEAVRERAPDVGSVAGLDVAAWIPVATRAHVLLERSEPEHRTITAAFIDLMDTDALLARLGPAAFADALDARLVAIQEAALRYEVPFYETDIGKSSIKALLTAGAPSATGHDEEQILRALREVVEQPGVLPLRIGVNTGKVFTGDFGPPYRRAYRVFGDAINTAARVMSRATAGQILATEIVLERSRTIFETTPIEPFQAKGKAEPVRASIVGPIVGRRGERAHAVPLVGRQAELDALLAVVDSVGTGAKWIVEVGGAVGIGKSRLVRELLDRRPGLAVVQSRCEEYERSIPYSALRGPFRAALGLAPDAGSAEVEAALRRVVSATAPELIPWLPLLGIVAGLDLPATAETAELDARFLRERLADVTVELLAAALGDAPAMLVLEDVQFMDEASFDLLDRIARSELRLPALLLITQPEPAAWTGLDEDAPPALALCLLPMPRQALAEIVGLATDERPLPPHAVDEIVRRSGGNPLFLFELVDAFRAGGTIEALPDSLDAMIAADIDRLAPADRSVLRDASVLGASFDRELLAAALRDEVELDDALWQRLRGLVDPDAAGRLHFRNTLVRDAAYEGLPFRRRRHLHARVAATIEAVAAAPDEEAPTLALHFFAAQAHEQAWRYGRLAGDRARAVAATVEAARFYELALTAGRQVKQLDVSDRVAVWIALGAVRETAGMFDASFDALRRATRLLPSDPVEQARVYTLRTRARMRTGAYANALRETAAGLRLVEGLDSPAAVGARALLRAMRSEVRMLQGHPREAIALAETAVAEGRAAQELQALTHAYTALDASYQLLGQPEKAVNELQALEIYERLGDTRGLGITELNLGVQANADGRWDEAVDLYTRAQETFLRAGDRQHNAIAGANLGEVLVGRGALDEAERVLTDARRVLRSTGFKPFALFAETQLARCTLERGDTAQAVASLERILAEAAEIDHGGIVLDVTIHFAVAAARAGRAEDGLAALDRAAVAAGDEAMLFAASLDRARAACLVSLGRVDEARVALARALESALGQSLMYEQLLVRRAQAALAEGGPGPEELRETERLAQLLGVPE